MKFARLIERGNRQILVTVGELEVNGENSITMCFQAHYIGDAVVYFTLTGFKSLAQASEMMMELEEEEIVSTVMKFIDDFDPTQADEDV